MGWWEMHDGTVIGDELADIAGDCLEEMVKKMVAEFPEVTRDQVLHTLAFCSGFLKHFDGAKKPNKDNKILLALPIAERNKWANKHQVPRDESKRVAPGTELMNVRSPFEEGRKPEKASASAIRRKTYKSDTIFEEAAV